MPGCDVTVIYKGNARVIPCAERESLLSALRRAGYSDFQAPCGGQGKCARCLVTVDGAPALACRTYPERECTVQLPEQGAERVITKGAGDIPPFGEGLGLAVDIGTTTVAAYLYDGATGKLLGGLGERNAQRPYGADVISRISCCGQGKLPELREAVREQLSQMAEKLCRQCGRETAEIKTAAIAGNTVMEHIFAGLSPVSIGAAPFTPLSLFGEAVPACEVLPNLSEEAEVYLCPALSGYVGGDITAGLLSSGAYEHEGVCLLLDIGTNGEMALGGRNGFVTCAAAAGPAFEGAEMDCGMPAQTGAVNSVKFENGHLKFTVIGEGEAVGICGSGLVSAAAALLRSGVVDQTGRMRAPDEAPTEFCENLRREENGELRFYLTDRVYISAVDIRQFQLAKSAIRAGLETLLARAGVTAEAVDTVFLAGGFGEYLPLDSAVETGLLPGEFRGRIRHAGNTAGAGAALALLTENRALLRETAEMCEYFELSGSAEFSEKFMEHIFFGGEE